MPLGSLFIAGAFGYLRASWRAYVSVSVTQGCAEDTSDHCKHEFYIFMVVSPSDMESTLWRNSSAKTIREALEKVSQNKLSIHFSPCTFCIFYLHQRKRQQNGRPLAKVAVASAPHSTPHSLHTHGYRCICILFAYSVAVPLTLSPSPSSFCLLSPNFSCLFYTILVETLPFAISPALGICICVCVGFRICICECVAKVQ